MVLLNRALLWTACAIFLLGTSNDILAQAVTSPASQTQSQTSNAPQASSETSGAGNSTAQTKSASELPDSPDATRADDQDSTPPSDQKQPPASAQNQKLQRPVGTAAAEAPKVNGVTAAQPAGVAIAPAKQHRVRTIVLRTGAILGAAAALGTVVALTATTPSKPPGAH